MNKPLILEDWELVYLQGAVAEKSGVGLDAIETVIKNYEGLQRKLEAAAGDEE